MTVLNTNKTPGPKQHTCNIIYKIPCKDCSDYYIGQTCRPIIKRITETIACYRLNNYIDSIGNIKSAPVKHSYDMDQTIDWNNTTILTVAQNRTQLNLLEHAAITVTNPTMNRQHKGPRISPLWEPILHNITKDFRPTTANIIFDIVSRDVCDWHCNLSACWTFNTPCSLLDICIYNIISFRFI